MNGTYDVVEIGDGHWSVHHAGTTRIAGMLQEDADGYRLTDAQETDLGSFRTVEDALTRLDGGD